MTRSLAFALTILLTITSIAACSRMSSSQVTTGEIRFENQSPEVSAYLASRSVDTDPGDSVGLYDATNFLSGQFSSYVPSGSTNPVASVLV